MSSASSEPRGRFGYYTQYRFTEKGVLKVSLISTTRMLGLAFLGPFLIVPMFLVIFSFYPNGVQSEPLLSILTALTMMVAFGFPFLTIFWSIRARAHTPDNALPASSSTLLPWTEVNKLQVLGRLVTIKTSRKNYVVSLQSDTGQAVGFFKKVVGEKLSYGVKDFGEIIRAKRIGVVGSLLVISVAIWRYASFFSSVYYVSAAAGLVLLIAVMLVGGSLSDVANSTSGNWITSRDWSIAGYFYAWFVLGLVAAGLTGVLAPRLGQLTLFGSLVPIYSSPTFPNDLQGVAGYVVVVGLSLLAGAFLTWSLNNTARKVNSGFFRLVGPSYIVSVLAFTLGGIALYPIFYVAQALAFLSMNVKEAQNA